MTHPSSYLYAIVFCLSVVCVQPAFAQNTIEQSQSTTTQTPSRDSGGLGLSTLQKRRPNVGFRKHVYPLWFKANNAYPWSQVDAVLSKRERKIHACYTKQYKTNRGFDGILNVSFQIGLKGKVRSVDVFSATRKTTGMIPCIKNEIKTWSFAKPKSGKVTVEGAFRFKVHRVFENKSQYNNNMSGTSLGYGPGKGFGPKPVQNVNPKRMPQVVPGKPSVKGALAKEIVRRVVRKHRGEVRLCYNKHTVVSKPWSGVIKVKFVIAKTGRVLSSELSSSSPGGEEVGACVVSKALKWTFPRPKDDGNVTVTYPFSFRS